MNDTSHQQIESRAYQLWEHRGQPWGSPETDWFQAEQELTLVNPESPLSKVAREVGGVLGTVVAFLAEKAAQVPSPDN